jgi:hypothetical protein
LSQEHASVWRDCLHRKAVRQDFYESQKLAKKTPDQSENENSVFALPQVSEEKSKLRVPGENRAFQLRHGPDI